MRRKFSEEQIVGLLEKADIGTSLATLCENNNISQGTYYKWRSRYNGLNVKEITVLQNLEKKVRILKRLYSQSLKEREVLQKALEGKL